MYLIFWKTVLCFVLYTVCSATPLIYTYKGRSCSTSEWRCADGTCLRFDWKCDGVVHCPDGSDETAQLCKNQPCQSNWFTCSYGACVDGDAPCNGVKDCADNSDEAESLCSTWSDPVHAQPKLNRTTTATPPLPGHVSYEVNDTSEILTNVIAGKTSCSTSQWRCRDGTCVRFDSKCDGVVHCPDGSDETAHFCKNQTCQSNWFTCSYGACVDGDAPCNGVKDCADNSDEAESLCSAREAPVNAQIVPNSKCILPQFPANGRYRVIGISFAIPGQRLDAAYLQVSCNAGHKISGTSNVMCLRGIWSNTMPECNRSCKLIGHPSVEYKCIVPGSQGGQRDCQEDEPVGTVAVPACRPNYYSHTLNYMHCSASGWDYVAICKQNLNRTGTNVTIVINDNVNVYISGFEYASQVTAITPTPVAKNEVEYEISEDDWRMASVGNNRNTTSYVANALEDNNKSGVNFFITNSTLVINNSFNR